jgi:hypothetical protein
LQAKGNLHYRRKDALRRLRRQLLYEIPVHPTEEDIKKISGAWSALTDQMNDLWEGTLQFDWANLARTNASFAGSSDQDGRRRRVSEPPHTVLHLS